MESLAEDECDRKMYSNCVHGDKTTACPPDASAGVTMALSKRTLYHTFAQSQVTCIVYGNSCVAAAIKEKFGLNSK